MDVERLRSILGPLANAVGARCLVLNPEGRAVFAVQPSASPCPARLENARSVLCPSRDCPFKGEPYLAPVQEHGLTVGQLFWCTGGRQTDHHGLTRGLAQAVATGAGAERLVEVNRLRHEIDIARTMQEALLPATVPDVEGLQLAANLREASNVGGDYYDFVPLGGGYLGLVIADVSGHGVSSAMMMTSFRMALLTELSREFSPAAALRRINTLLYRDCDRSRMFVTAVLAVYEPLTGNLQYANAGHNPPRIRRAGRREVTRLAATGVPIGMFEDMEYTEASVVLEQGDALVLYTDGLVENRNPAGVALGETSLDRALSIAGGDAKDLLAFLLALSDRHLAGVEPKDDVTVVVATRTF
jgi:serine phosphatase RsbU (regulator of sigma subunit)